MLRKTIILAVTIIWLMLPASSMGQESLPGKWWHMPKVGKQIDLTNREKQTLDDLYEMGSAPWELWRQRHNGLASGSRSVALGPAEARAPMRKP